MTATAPTQAATPTTPGSNPLDALSVAAAQRAAPPPQTSAVSQDSFLNLLVAQLRNQDPLQPVQNTEFIQQLATMQSLQSQLDSNKSIKDLVQIQESQLGLAGLSQAALLVGKAVTWTDKDGHDGGGTVQSVTVENGVMMINTENGKVPVGALTSIAQAPPPAGSGTGPDAGAPGTTPPPDASSGSSSSPGSFTTAGTTTTSGPSGPPNFSHG